MNANEVKLETKEKILQAAEELFAEFGYGGASIRDIAARSDTNIAAINYHFKSKDNLYWQVMDRSHRILEDGVAAGAASAQSVEDLTMHTFDFLLLHASAFRNAMKMMLNDGVGDPDPEGEPLACVEKPGPPGYQYFLPLIQKECGPSVSLVAADWGVKAIFASIMWWSLLTASNKCRKMAELDPSFTPEFFKSHVRTHARAVMEGLKTRHQDIAASLPPIPPSMIRD